MMSASASKAGVLEMMYGRKVPRPVFGLHEALAPSRVTAVGQMNATPEIAAKTAVR